MKKVSPTKPRGRPSKPQKQRPYTFRISIDVLRDLKHIAIDEGLDLNVLIEEQILKPWLRDRTGGNGATRRDMKEAHRASALASTPPSPCAIETASSRSTTAPATSDPETSMPVASPGIGALADWPPTYVPTSKLSQAMTAFRERASLRPWDAATRAGLPNADWQAIEFHRRAATPEEEDKIWAILK